MNTGLRPLGLGAFAFALIALPPAGRAALPPDAPTDADECRVAPSGDAKIEQKPPKSGQPAAPGPGAGRIYTLPATLDCRAESKDTGEFYCSPRFIAWATQRCPGVMIRQ